MLNENLAKHFMLRFKTQYLRLALLSLLFFRLSLKKYVHLKRTFYVQKFEV